MDRCTSRITCGTRTNMKGNRMRRHIKGTDNLLMLFHVILVQWLCCVDFLLPWPLLRHVTPIHFIGLVVNMWAWQGVYERLTGEDVFISSAHIEKIKALVWKTSSPTDEQFFKWKSFRKEPTERKYSSSIKKNYVHLVINLLISVHFIFSSDEQLITPGPTGLTSIFLFWS